MLHVTFFSPCRRRGHSGGPHSEWLYQPQDFPAHFHYLHLPRLWHYTGGLFSIHHAAEQLAWGEKEENSLECYCVLFWSEVVITTTHTRPFPRPRSQVKIARTWWRSTCLRWILASPQCRSQWRKVLFPQRPPQTCLWRARHLARQMTWGCGKFSSTMHLWRRRKCTCRFLSVRLILFLASWSVN